MNILKVAICHDASVRQYCILVVLYSIQAELERDSHGIGYNVAGARVWTRLTADVSDDVLQGLGGSSLQGFRVTGPRQGKA